jgi:hypothetical protein
MSEKELNGITPQVALIGMAKELTMDDVEPKQFGNTVFIGHYTDDKTGVYMRALNMDTAKNFVDNGEQYIKYLLDQGVDKMYSEFKGSQLLHVFKLFSKRPGTKDMIFNYFKIDENTTGVEVVLDPSKNPEPGVVQPLLSGVEDLQNEPL